MGNDIFICLLLSIFGLICCLKLSTAYDSNSFLLKMRMAGHELEKDKDELKYSKNVMRALGATEKEIEDEWRDFNADGTRKQT